MKTFYCAFESIFDSVFDSQVVTFLENINRSIDKEEQKVRLIIFNSIGDIFKKGYLKKRKEIKRRLKGKCSFSIKIPYMYNFPNLFNLSLTINTLIAALVFMNPKRKNTKGIAIHCRTEIGSYILLNLKRFFKLKMKVICDCRGIGSKEILYKLDSRRGELISDKIEKVERFAWNNSDYIFCVSKSFKEYILENKISKTGKIKVVPCCVDKEKFKFNSDIRKSVRAELKLDKKFVIIYSGSMNEWQLPGEMVNIFKEFKEKVRNSIFLILTGDYNFAMGYMKECDLDNNDYMVASKSPDQVSRYLHAGDLALLIREDNEVNRVAFPVKFGEYIRSGVPVLSSITSDVKEFIKKYNLGFVINDFRDLKEIKGIVWNIKKNIDYITSDRYKRLISEKPGRKLTWDNYVSSIIEIYHREFNL